MWRQVCNLPNPTGKLQTCRHMLFEALTGQGLATMLGFAIVGCGMIARFHARALAEVPGARLTLGETTCKWWRPQSYYDEGGWKGTLALDGGGALMNQAIHNVDLLLWLMGPATHLSGFTATLAHERIEVEDTAVACLRFANGALGIIEATTSVHPGFPKTIAVHGDHGSVVIEQDDVLRWDLTPEIPEDRLLKERFAQKV